MDASERASARRAGAREPGPAHLQGGGLRGAFPHLEAVKAATALRKSLSMARSALSALGHDATQVLAADRDRIWVDATRAGLSLEVDLDTHQAALRGGLALAPGADGDERLEAALAQEGTLLEDEPYADWALRRREAIEALRQEARLGSSPRSCQRRGAVECGRRCALVGVLHRTRPGMRGGGGRFDAELLSARTTPPSRTHIRPLPCRP